MLTGRMSWLNSRQQVLAQNIANADTPGYVPRDLKSPTFRDLVRSEGVKMTPTTTNVAHIQGSGKVERFANKDQKETYESMPDGNAVVLEEQLMKVSQTQADYQTATNLYRRYLSMFRTVIGRN
ncbi:MAG: flagellar basal body rod protein FlgB [Alphaproteobacteria bacterium]|nr:flagellar basal body rod protein FlgB [Alphaproteobacteria bacterium]